jgi:hypothetical protein
MLIILLVVVLLIVAVGSFDAWLAGAASGLSAIILASVYGLSLVSTALASVVRRERRFLIITHKPNADETNSSGEPR